MTDQNMIVFSYWLKRQCSLLYYYDEEDKKNGGPEHCQRVDLNYRSELLPFTIEADINAAGYSRKLTNDS